MTADPVYPRPDRRTKNTRVAFSSAEESKMVFDGHSNLSKEASEQKHVNVKLAVQTDEEQTPRTSKREDQISPHLQPDSDWQIFKDGHREDIKSISLQIRTASRLGSHTLADSPRPKSCVKWKNVLLQRARGSAAAPCESRYQTHQSWSRFTRADRSSPEGGSHADERNHSVPLKLRWSTVLPETR